MNLLISLIIFFGAVILHEYSHGWVAYKLGDPTAKYAGRLTLNPIEHIDPFGTILLPLILIILKLPVFGYAKPVPVNFWNLRNPRRDMIWVGLAGPMTNFLLAAILSFFLKIISLGIIREFLYTAIIINLLLAVFNLLPIPPLDGSRVVSGILPYRYAQIYNEWERYGVMLIFLLLFLGFFNVIIWPIVGLLANLLGVLML